MSRSCINRNPLEHEGTSQNQRTVHSLDPGSVKLHDLSERDWLEFARKFARLVNLYPADNPDRAAGDWQEFFPASDKIVSLLEDGPDGETDPHLALFITFLKLLEFPQESLNRLPKRHLDYYFREVLQLREKSAVPDRVHVLFELAQNAKSELIKAGTLLDAGDDSDGHSLHYKVVSPLVVNPAVISSVRSVYTDQNGHLLHAPDTRTEDGMEGDMEEGQTWQAFGDPDWPMATLGFYLESHLLRLREGRRKITLDLEFEGSVKPEIDFGELQLFFTGEDGWIRSRKITVSEPEDDYMPGMRWTATIAPEDDAVVGYDEEIHEEGLHSEEPVMKVVFTRPEVYAQLKKVVLKRFRLKVDVTAVESLQMQNELGIVDPTKPFMPFGTSPKIGSKLVIRYDEMDGKPVTGLSFNMAWLNLPQNFSEHYSHYMEAIQKQEESLAVMLTGTIQYYNVGHSLLIDSPILSQSAVAIANSDVSGQEPSEGTGIRTESGGRVSDQPVMRGDTPSEAERTTQARLRVNMTLQSTASEGEDEMKDQFMVRVRPPQQENRDFKIFSNDEPVIDVDLEKGSLAAAKGKIEMILLSSFYHDLYPKLYVAETVRAGKMDKDEVSADLLPNPPYTPLLDEFTLNYSAETEIDLDEQEDETSGREELTGAETILYQRLPFGIRKCTEKNRTLLPDYRHRYLYIGLEKIEAGSQVSLLFQVDEGSENPENSYFQEGEEPGWHMLSGDEWLELTDESIIRNDTRNFLKSGVVELQIPRESTTDHRILDSGKRWIRITLQKPENAVSRFVNIHTQAAEAVYAGRNGETSTSGSIPAETVSQLVNRRSAVKSAEQPYVSSGGRSRESSAGFYRRTSERLRHKSRAVTIWDYEHLILEQFPEIHKVKCLNHTRVDGESLNQFAPGHVTLVLIPRLRGENLRYRLKPRVSQGLLDDVESFLKDRHSAHVHIRAVNPVYEEVTFEFRVRFREGLDYHHYRQKTDEDLKRLMAPWFFETSAEIRFAESFYRYEMIRYLEELGYIKNIQDFYMLHGPAGGDATRKERVQPSSPRAILVPSGSHDIKPSNSC